MASNRSRRYPPRLVAYVEELGKRGYRTNQAQALLGKMGVNPVPARETIKRWLDPDYAEADRMRQRKGRLPGPAPQRKWSWQRKRQRLLELRELGISFEAVARVMNHDYGLSLSNENVRHICHRSYSEALVKRLMMGGPLPARRGRRAVASLQDGRNDLSQA